MKIYPSILIFILFHTAVTAMMSDGVHEMKDYTELAKSAPEFDSVGALHDHSTHSGQTAVLVGRRSVLTAAHGVIHNKDPRQITISFDIKGKRYVYRGASVHLDPRYITAPSEMFDFAIVSLERDVVEVDPVMLPKEQSFVEHPELMCVTYGSKDIDPMFEVKRRAFALPETSAFTYQGELPDLIDREGESVAISSLYIAPTKNFRGPKPSIWKRLWNFLTGRADLSEEQVEYLESEIYPRQDAGYKLWAKRGHIPYALALPGSSGAPVFRKYEEKWVLFGVITSFSHIPSPLFEVKSSKNLADIVLSMDKEIAYGHFQTIFTILYKEKRDQGKKIYIMDEEILPKKILENE